MHKVYLKPGKEESLKRFHPWIFSGAIARFDGEPEEGEVVEVYTSKKEFIAEGHFQIGSIAVRVLSFRQEPINHDFWKRKLEIAYDMRCAIGIAINPVNDTYRLVHGEGDNLPGLVIDIYAKTAVMQAHSAGMHVDRMTIAEALSEVMGDKIENIYYKSETTLPFKADLFPENGFLKGGSSDNIAQEYGLKFHVDWLKGQKTGFFLDQKYNRLAIQRICKDAKVLDCFRHTGSFALNAGIAGASRVLGVYASELAIAQARENAALNGLESTVSFECRDVFDLLPELESKGEQFDVVILDPPAFTKSRNSIKNAVKGYREINLRAMKLVRDGGFLATCSCSHFMDFELFTKTIKQAAMNSHVRLRQVEFRTQAPDHPILWAADESYYLKFYIFQVIKER